MEYRYVPVGELADLLHPSTSKWKALAMLRAYFDASKTQVQVGITAIAGYVAPKEAWERLEPLWMKDVAQWNIPRFHRSEVHHRLGRERGDLCIKAFAKLIEPILHDAVWSAVVDEDWNNLKKPPGFSARFPTSLHFAFEHVVYQLCEWGKLKAEGETIAPVFDDDMSPAAANAIYEEYKTSEHHPGVMSSMTWASAGQHRMIETADLAASEMQRFWFDREYPGEGRQIDIAPQMRTAMSGKAFSDSGLWDGLSLQVAVKDFVERAQYCI